MSISEDISRLLVEMPSTAILTLKFWDGYHWLEYEVEGAIQSFDFQQSRQPIYELGRREPVYFTGGRTDSITFKMTPNTMVARTFDQDGQEIKTKKEQTKPILDKQTKQIRSILLDEDEE